MFPSAYLRVFRPVDSFGDEERARWERYILAGGPPSARGRVYRDESGGRTRPVGLLAPAEGEHADVRFEDGSYHVCPWRTRLRILTGIVSLRDSAPPEMVDVLLPEAELRRAARELARIKRREPALAPSILQSPWHVPVRWFVLVDDDERRLEPSREGGYRVRYWTAIGTARRRAERAVQVLRRSELAPVGDVIRELAEWLSAFHPSSKLELDYGEVSSLFSWDELDNDHSGREIQEAVEALSRPGGMARAAELYESVSNRWADAMSRESLN